MKLYTLITALAILPAAALADEVGAPLDIRSDIQRQQDEEYRDLATQLGINDIGNFVVAEAAPIGLVGTPWPPGSELVAELGTPEYEQLRAEGIEMLKEAFASQAQARGDLPHDCPRPTAEEDAADCD